MAHESVQDAADEFLLVVVNLPDSDEGIGRRNDVGVRG